MGLSSAPGPASKRQACHFCVRSILPPVPVSRNVRLLSAFNFFEDFRPYAPFIVLYLAQVTGSYAAGGGVIALSMVAWSAFEVPTGILSDMVGRVRTMALGAISTALGMMLWSMGTSTASLAAGSVVMGLGAAFASGNNVAFLHDTLAEEGRGDEYAHFLGRTSALFQVGLGVSALFGGLLALHSLRATMLAGIVPPVLGTILTFFMTEPRVHASGESTNVFAHVGEALRHFRKNARLRNLSMASMLDWGLGQAQWDFLPVFLGSLWPAWAVGIARTLSHIFACLSFWFAGRVLKRFEPLRTLIAGRAFCESVAIVIYAVPTVASPLILSVLSGFFGIKKTAEGTLLQREFTDRQRATMGSLNQLGGSLVFGACAILLGVLADRVGIVQTLIISEFVLLLGIFFYRQAFRHGKAGSDLRVEHA
ncbi:MAG: hypothetical protein Greene041619_614 [Candidatus Peregrinibacteria bacterium Greene0416_19]|nr:MAG: hypothetical protein Greene041619_614 [Candidatus Peregrinibacteria bacterium Greene0416_19]